MPNDDDDDDDDEANACALPWWMTHDDDQDMAVDDETSSTALVVPDEMRTQEFLRGQPHCHAGRVCAVPRLSACWPDVEGSGLDT
jgi:hypothetical protein